jgi:hypothetical protein
MEYLVELAGRDILLHLLIPFVVSPTTPPALSLLWAA